MGDELSLLDWRIRFENWVEFAKPMFTEGKAKEAFAKYPWFSTEGDPFIKPAKPASEMRFGLITTGVVLPRSSGHQVKSG